MGTREQVIGFEDLRDGAYQALAGIGWLEPRLSEEDLHEVSTQVATFLHPRVNKGGGARCDYAGCEITIDPDSGPFCFFHREREDDGTRSDGVEVPSRQRAMFLHIWNTRGLPMIDCAEIAEGLEVMLQELCPKYWEPILPDEENRCSLCGAPDQHQGEG